MFVKQVFLLFIISCQSLKNSSRGKKRPEPRGLLNQAKREMPPEKKTAVPAVGRRATCLLSGSHRLRDGTQVGASPPCICLLTFWANGNKWKTEWLLRQSSFYGHSPIPSWKSGGADREPLGLGSPPSSLACVGRNCCSCEHFQHVRRCAMQARSLT